MTPKKTTKISKKTRLQKILAEAGLFSRRKAEESILAGRVTVNGETITRLGFKADPANDSITCDGNPVKHQPKTYILLNKPAGVLSTCSDDRARKSVVDLIDNIGERLYPVGRLDFNTTGAIILTNDGGFAQKMMHPSSGVTKTYVAKVRGLVEGKTLKKMRSGITLEGVKLRFHKVAAERATGSNSFLKIDLQEGKNLHIKKLCKALGHPVSKLSRVSYGPIKLTGLESGDYRHLSGNEIKSLLLSAGHKKISR